MGRTRGGFPARVKGTDKQGAGGLLRIDNPGITGEERLERIDWQEFFAAFDENKLRISLPGQARERGNK